MTHSPHFWDKFFFSMHNIIWPLTSSCVSRKTQWANSKKTSRQKGRRRGQQTLIHETLPAMPESPKNILFIKFVFNLMAEFSLDTQTLSKSTYINHLGSSNYVMYYQIISRRGSRYLCYLKQSFQKIFQKTTLPCEMQNKTPQQGNYSDVK